MAVGDVQQCPRCGTRVVAKADGACPACQSVLFHLDSPLSTESPEPVAFLKSVPPCATAPESIQSLYDEAFPPFAWRRVWQYLCIGSLCLLAAFVVMDKSTIPNRHSEDRLGARVIVQGLIALAQLVCYTSVAIFAIGWIICRPRLTSDVQRIKARGVDCQFAASRALRIPSSALLLLSVVAIALDLAVMGRQRFDDSNGASVAVMGLLLLMHLFIMFGAVQMSKLKHYSIAWLVGGMSVVPFCSPVVILGIPFGIWVLLRLSDRLVMDAFVHNSVCSSIERHAEDAGSIAMSERHPEQCPYCDNTVIPSIDGRCPKCHRPIA